MFKKSLLALAVLGSSSAFAATNLPDATEVNFATELFGTSDVVLGNTVVLNVTDAVSNGATASFTYTLSNGTFGANPTLAFSNGGATAGNAGVSLTAGGQGSSSATFTVVVTEGFTGDEVFTLTVPSLADVTALSASTGVVSVAPTVTNTNIVATGFSQTITPVGGGTLAENGTIATNSAGIELAATGSTPLITVADQTQFDGGSATTVDLFTSVELQAPAGPAAVEEDGTTVFAIGTGDTAQISVTGNVADGGQICLVPAADTTCATAVGTSTTTATGATIALTAANVATIDAAAHDIIYVVDGEATIPVTDFSISSTVTYADVEYAGTVTYNNAAEAALGLSGLTAMNDAARINIITRPGAVDPTFIRVTNTGGASTEVYINLTTQDGASSAFGRLGTLAAGATAVYSSEDVAAATGLSTWAGRANGKLSVSTGTENDITIVPLIRTNDVLTNQASYLRN